MDLYVLLGIEEKVVDKEVKKVYRQKVFFCYLDKNLDNFRVVEFFYQFFQVLEVLIDVVVRVVYDKVRKVKK